MDRLVLETYKKQYYLFYDFAFRICYRYTYLTSDAERAVFVSFVKLFSSGNALPLTIQELEKDLKKILITSCINITRMTSKNRTRKDDTAIYCATENEGEKLSPKELIDLVRQLPFPSIAVYNMAVIDNYHLGEIAAALNITCDQANTYLQSSKKYLRKKIEAQSYKMVAG